MSDVGLRYFIFTTIGLCLLSCVVSIVAVFLAYKLVKHSALKSGDQANLTYQFFLRYSDEKMRDALIKISEFKKNTSRQENYIADWWDAVEDKEDWAVELNEARRIIKYFYRDVAILYQSDCIDYQLVEKICTAGGIFLFMDCVLPMEKRNNELPYENEFYPIPQIAKKMRALRSEKQDDI